ncbi:MAG TPA: AAA family ATPase [Candidatus Omnitrophota bacterium]|nr:AAA family ATPase [Candidatus Omnitrophota bacterium]HPD84050.1 AAA family ATPase [Candidatus Omnitrophota bacterium]HRZ02907.1 AAA family ATPase [Candidatus Omnitrophota bacterium]
MYLKKLEIFGFKSFAEKTVLNFEPGITAVVGPNGCGKSNIFDSIRWVLGEQSVKELRGSSMEDVIFNGTDTKSPLGFAEVSLTFSNESKMLPIEYDEVVVTRRLFRSGESEYLLNKTVVRLKDILELFMGTGIGAEAYSLVQQGKVDLIVSARPEDRRMILDEAAGITKYKSKKKEALSKLSDTENNLLRINDIIVEVKRQIASIERQASKARRYKEEFEKLTNLEIQLARHQIRSFAQQVDGINLSLGQLKDEETRLNQEIEKLNSLMNEENNLSLDLGRKISEVRSEDVRFENQITMDSRQIGFNQERMADLTANQERLGQQKAQLLERCRAQEEKIKALELSLDSLVESTQNSIKLLEEKKNSLIAIAETIKNSKESIVDDEVKILDLTSQQVNIKNELTEIMKEFQGFLARKRRLDIENEKVLGEKDQVDNRLKTVCADVEICLSKIGELKTQKESQSRSLDDLKLKLSSLEQSCGELERKKLFLKSQKEFIENLRVQYQDIPDPVVEGTLLTTTLPQENCKGIIGKVTASHPLDAQKAMALKSYLPRISQENLYEVTCEAKFIELDPQHIIIQIDELSLQIESLLREKEGVAAAIKSQEESILSVDRVIHDHERVLSSYDAQKTQILEEVGKLTSELDLVDAELSEAKSSLASLKAKEEDHAHRLEAVDEEILALQSRIKDNQNAIALKTQEREEINVAVAQLETEIGSVKDKERGYQENLKVLRDVLDNDQQTIERVDQENIEHGQKKEILAQDITALNSKIEELKGRRESLKESIAALEEQKNEVGLRISDIRKKNDDLLQEIENVKGLMHQQQMKCQEISFSEKSIKDKLLQTYKINLDEIIAQEQLPAQAGTVTPEAESAVAQAESVISAAESIDTPIAAENIPVSQPVQISPEEMMSQIEQLKKKCESFGTVNLVAIEEFDELRQRFEFLTKQQSDLLTAKDSLMSTIGKINRTTRQIFLDTFTKVSEEFRIYFRMLFGGGEAQLVLVDPENVLESGIEIIARPPGKKLQNITLLSGGEKTLAAIALIFGVFKVRPSPFCVLDEIDAALDESNVGRYGYLLKDFAKIAQFIVITHNKKTIVNANIMYGITMQESGVSKIVSVKFGDNQQQQTSGVREGKQEAVTAGVS